MADWLIFLVFLLSGTINGIAFFTLLNASIGFSFSLLRQLPFSHFFPASKVSLLSILSHFLCHCGLGFKKFFCGFQKVEVLNECANCSIFTRWCQFFFFQTCHLCIFFCELSVHVSDNLISTLLCFSYFLAWALCYYFNHWPLIFSVQLISKPT